MTKWKRFLLLVMLMAVCLTGCSLKNTETENERTEVVFDLVDVREIPEKLLELIEKNKKEEIRLSYKDGEDLYLVRGYGEQKTGGYSIAVAECTEDETAIWFDTRLLGPDNQKKHSKNPSYPYLVIKMKWQEKEIMIE